jgi:hypothetical protein
MSDLFAHTRTGDPDTSHAAAQAITPKLTDIQRQVSAYARRAGPEGFVAIEAEIAFEDGGSTIRTRISELAERNILFDSGRRRTHGESARQRIIWVHREFMTNAPPIIEPEDEAQTGARPATAPMAISDADKADCSRLGAELARAADYYREHGFLFANRIEEAGRLLARLGR